MNEITIKYWNPFHIFFWDEPMFFKILKKNFKNIQIIRNCGPDESDNKEFKFISIIQNTEIIQILLVYQFQIIMINKKLITIVTPNLNGGMYLKTIKSVICQKNH